MSTMVNKNNKKSNKTPKKQSITNKKNNSMLNPNYQESQELTYIREKRAYNHFMKLIREDKFTTAVVSSKILGVSRPTIYKWLKTPRVIKAMKQTTDKYVKSIEKSKDWKSKKYLLDKLEGTKEQQDTTNLQQLIVINTK